jgi:hypothetical protein
LEKNMNKILVITIAIAVSAAFACSGGGGYGAPSGSIMQTVTLNKDVSTAAAPGKSGEACATGYLGIVSSGDAGIKAAATAGKITKVNAVDYKVDNLLGSVVQKTCTIAYGD